MHPNSVDSLRRAIEHIPANQGKIDTLINIASHFQHRNQYHKASEALELARTLAYRSKSDNALTDITLEKSRLSLAQNQYEEALKLAEDILLYNKQTDNHRNVTRAILLIADIYSAQSQSSEAIKFYDSAVNLSNKHGLNNIKAEALLLLSIEHNIQSNIDASKKYADQALGIYQSLNDQRGLSRTYNIIGENHRILADYTEALKYFKMALAIAEKNKLENMNAMLNNIGLIYINQKRFVQAIDIYKELISLNKKDNDLTGLALNYNNLGLSYAGINEHEEAIHYYNLGLKVDTGSKRICLLLFYNIGESNMVLQNNAEALEYLGKAFALSMETGNIDAQAHCYNALGRVYYQQGRYNKAEEYLKEGLALSRQLSSKKALLNNYENKYKLDSARGDYHKALAWQREYYRLQKEIDDDLKNKEIAETISKYELEKKDKEIMALTRSKELEAINRNNERTLYILLLTFLAVLALLLTYFGRRRRMINKLLSVQKDEIEQKNRKLNSINNEINEVLETIEEQNDMLHTKNLKLEELHEEKDALIGIVAHDLRSPIAKAAGLAELIEVAGPLNEKQQELMDLQKRVCDNGSALIEDLLMINMAENRAAKATKTYFNLDELIDELSANYTQMARKKKISFKLGSDIDPKQAIYTDKDYLIRILDNLVSNAIKFSYPFQTVWLDVSIDTPYLRFTVKDEGPGLSEEDKTNVFKKFKRLSATPTAGESSTGLGLSIVKMLTEKLGGDIMLHSEQRKGATFILTIPVDHALQIPREKQLSMSEK